ncbi:acyltransferase family protein [Microbacterium lushaniae]|uniref:Acyltransferase family protein n=1 Tax=Microbacterium lushaniae TaxID=2614639 RepID=A0A5J6L0U4_9MICO|nr:acyltransferase family protein [Microbacterium lushaniae]QEW02108.1 acyltransferase family protein [Microbacterium lushaniae]
MTLPASPRPARFAGLDGLRAIAVALVIVYHLFPGWVFAGGFVGVDVFFVISGFLITTLLLSERERTGRISLSGFWKRRARRLLPALALVVTVCASAAWLVGGDVLARVGAQVLGAATFGYNWISLAEGSSYFAASAPELLRNLWSLAVEEQFYVVWPLLLPLVLLLPWRAARVGLALAAAAASAWWMARLVVEDGAVTRAYFGTDSHAFGILIGVALAFAMQRVLHDPPAWMQRRPWRVGALAAGVAAVAGIVWVGTLPATDSAATFPGALLAASVLTAVAIAAGVWPGSWFGRGIDAAPLRWIGDRSYGLYLWHWPLVILLAAGSAPGAGVPAGTGVVSLALTAAFAEASYRFVETPVRRHGFRGAVRRLAASLTGGPVRRLGALATVTCAVLVLGGTTAAIAGAPAATTAQSAVQAGIDALRDQEAAPAATPEPEPTATPAPSPTPVQGAEITAVGDSVMLASAPALVERFPGIHVDASVSRSMYAAPGILEQLEAAGTLRRYVVVALGTNGSIERSTLQRMREIVGPDRILILVTAHAPRDWIAGVNEELTTFARITGVGLADWAGAVAPRPDVLAGDGIHPGDAGGVLFADTVAGAVDAAEARRAASAQK